MISSDVSTATSTDDQKPKELENFIIEQSSQQNLQNQQHQTINIIDSKLLTTSQLNAQSQVQQIIASNSNANNLPFIIQNGNIYQLTTTTNSTNQINSSNLIQISGDNLKTNPIKLTTIKNANVLNLNTVNKSRIIVKTNPSDLSQGQQIITTISPNSLNTQKLNQHNQLKAINLVLQNSNQAKQLIIANQQNKPQITNQNGSPIIVLTPSNRTINDQNLQILLQQKSQNVQTNTFPVISQTQPAIQQVKASTIQQKIFIPQAQTSNLNLVKKNVGQINENELKTVEIKNSNPNLINLLNSNSNSNEVKQESVSLNNQPKIIYTKPQKEIANITPIASKTVQNLPNQNTVQANHAEAQKEEINEAILNECILPDTRIFASLLNKDHSLPNNNSNTAQKNEIKYKTVLIGNTEHVILDNLQNLSDFKGNFSELKNLACSVADHLNKSVSIPAFLLIDSKSSAEKIKTILGDININPIIIDTLTQNSQQTEAKQTQNDPNTDREKFNQHHQTLIKKLSSTQPDVTNPVNSDLAKQKKITTPKRRSTKPKKTPIILNSNGQPLVNKSKLTINDLIQQNAMNQSLEMEKSSEPTAKKIKTINQLVNVEQKLVQPVVNIQSVQQLPTIQQIPMQQEPPKLQTQQSNDWLDQQIQIANEFIDTLTKNDENERMIKNESLDLIKNEPVISMQNLVDVDQQQNSNANLQILSNDYNFEIDPFDTNLYFSSNLNDIEF